MVSDKAVTRLIRVGLPLKSGLRSLHRKRVGGETANGNLLKLYYRGCWMGSKCVACAKAIPRGYTCTIPPGRVWKG